MASRWRPIRQRVRARSQVQPGSERFALVLALDDDHLADDQRRGGHSDVVAGGGAIMGQSAKPLQVAVEVETGDVVRREEGHDAPAVGGRGVDRHHARSRLYSVWRWPKAAGARGGSHRQRRSKQMQPVLLRALEAVTNTRSPTTIGLAARPGSRPSGHVLLRGELGRQAGLVRTTRVVRAAELPPISPRQPRGQHGNDLRNGTFSHVSIKRKIRCYVSPAAPPRPHIAPRSQAPAWERSPHHPPPPIGRQPPGFCCEWTACRSRRRPEAES